MRLLNLLVDFVYTLIQGDINTLVNDISCDSRNVGNDFAFVCIRGESSDGHVFANQAIENGAAVIIAEQEIEVREDTTLIVVEDTREALAYMSASFFGYPSRQLKTIGITGTKGKTTISYMIKEILEKSGIKTGLIGTIETIIGDKKIKSVNTTPESYYLQKYLSGMVEAGCQCVVMEVSSQGLKHKRVCGINFDYAAISNIEPDHIGKNEHHNFEEYASCKARLFSQCKLAIVNKDDEAVLDSLGQMTCPVEYISRRQTAHLWAENIQHKIYEDNLGLCFDMKGLYNFRIQIPMPGIFNVENVLIAAAICRHFNVSEEAVNEGLKNVKIKGRVQILPGPEDYTVMIDYAHNASSLRQILKTLKDYHPKRLICVFGCGGNRSKYRRYEMGEVSGRLADITVVTSDNPRNEEPMEIIDDILTGVKKTDGEYYVIPDRSEAIREVINSAEPGDIIVFAGKGHENYQEINGKRYAYNEESIILDQINR